MQMNYINIKPKINPLVISCFSRFSKKRQIATRKLMHGFFSSKSLFACLVFPRLIERNHKKWQKKLSLMGKTEQINKNFVQKARFYDGAIEKQIKEKNQFYLSRNKTLKKPAFVLRPLVFNRSIENVRSPGNIQAKGCISRFCFFSHYIDKKNKKFFALQPRVFNRSIENGRSPAIKISAVASWETEHKFFSRKFDKNRLKKFVIWFHYKWGLPKTLQLLETLKVLGFKYAQLSGLSINIEDLYVPDKKKFLLDRNYSSLLEQELQIFQKTHVDNESSINFISTWGVINQLLRNAFLKYFKTGINSFKDSLFKTRQSKVVASNSIYHNGKFKDEKWGETNRFSRSKRLGYLEQINYIGSDSLYIMAFSGARGNMSQVGQLTLMRGLMSDPLGNLVEYPIISNFKEGLNLSEFLVSCYGARKGIIDTGIRTATAGDFTRRLVDVAHSVIIRSYDCFTKNGIYLDDVVLFPSQKTLLSFEQRLIGRIIANNSRISENYRNKEIPFSKFFMNFSSFSSISSILSKNNDEEIQFNKKTNDKTVLVKTHSDSFINSSSISGLSRFGDVLKPKHFTDQRISKTELTEMEEQNRFAFYTDNKSDEKNTSNPSRSDFQTPISPSGKEKVSVPFLRASQEETEQKEIHKRSDEKTNEKNQSTATSLFKIQEEILVRSPLTCEGKFTSLCRKCYGWNAIGRIVDLGEAVGVIAAQSLGEPGTQLTLRTFHTGGVYVESSKEVKLVISLDGNLIIPNYCGIKNYYNVREKISTFLAWNKKSIYHYDYSSTVPSFFPLVDSSEQTIESQKNTDYNSSFISKTPMKDLYESNRFLLSATLFAKNREIFDKPFYLLENTNEKLWQFGDEKQNSKNHNKQENHVHNSRFYFFYPAYEKIHNQLPITRNYNISKRLTWLPLPRKKKKNEKYDNFLLYHPNLEIIPVDNRYTSDLFSAQQTMTHKNQQVVRGLSEKVNSFPEKLIENMTLFGDYKKNETEYFRKSIIESIFKNCFTPKFVMKFFQNTLPTARQNGPSFSSSTYGKEKGGAKRRTFNKDLSVPYEMWNEEKLIEKKIGKNSFSGFNESVPEQVNDNIFQSILNHSYDKKTTSLIKNFFKINKLLNTQADFYSPLYMFNAFSFNIDKSTSTVSHFINQLQMSNSLLYHNNVRSEHNSNQAFPYKKAKASGFHNEWMKDRMVELESLNILETSNYEKQKTSYEIWEVPLMSKPSSIFPSFEDIFHFPSEGAKAAQRHVFFSMKSKKKTWRSAKADFFLSDEKINNDKLENNILFQNFFNWNQNQDIIVLKNRQLNPIQNNNISLTLFESTLIFSHYFISYFYEISSQLYITNLKILNPFDNNNSINISKDYEKIMKPQPYHHQNNISNSIFFDNFCTIEEKTKHAVAASQKKTFAPVSLFQINNWKRSDEKKPFIKSNKLSNNLQQIITSKKQSNFWQTKHVNVANDKNNIVFQEIQKFYHYQNFFISNSLLQAINKKNYEYQITKYFNQVPEQNIKKNSISTFLFPNINKQNLPHFKRLAWFLFQLKSNTSFLSSSTRSSNLFFSEPAHETAQAWSFLSNQNSTWKDKLTIPFSQNKKNINYEHAVAASQKKNKTFAPYFFFPMSFFLKSGLKKVIKGRFFPVFPKEQKLLFFYFFSPEQIELRRERSDKINWNQKKFSRTSLPDKLSLFQRKLINTKECSEEIGRKEIKSNSRAAGLEKKNTKSKKKKFTFLDLEQFAYQNYQTTELIIFINAEGYCKKNTSLFDIQKLPDIVLKKKENHFFFTIPLKKGIFNQESPSYLPTTRFMSSFFNYKLLSKPFSLPITLLSLEKLKKHSIVSTYHGIQILFMKRSILKSSLFAEFLCLMSTKDKENEAKAFLCRLPVYWQKKQKRDIQALACILAGGKKHDAKAGGKKQPFFGSRSKKRTVFFHDAKANISVFSKSKTRLGKEKASFHDLLSIVQFSSRFSFNLFTQKNLKESLNKKSFFNRKDLLVPHFFSKSGLLEKNKKINNNYKKQSYLWLFLSLINIYHFYFRLEKPFISAMQREKVSHKEKANLLFDTGNLTLKKGDMVNRFKKQNNEKYKIFKTFSLIKFFFKEFSITQNSQTLFFSFLYSSFYKEWKQQKKNIIFSSSSELYFSPSSFFTFTLCNLIPEQVNKKAFAERHVFFFDFIEKKTWRCAAFALSKKKNVENKNDLFFHEYFSSMKNEKNEAFPLSLLLFPNRKENMKKYKTKRERKLSRLDFFSLRKAFSRKKATASSFHTDPFFPRIEDKKGRYSIFFYKKKFHNEQIKWKKTTRTPFPFIWSETVKHYFFTPEKNSKEKMFSKFSSGFYFMNKKFKRVFLFADSYTKKNQKTSINNQTNCNINVVFLQKKECFINSTFYSIERGSNFYFFRNKLVTGCKRQNKILWYSLISAGSKKFHYNLFSPGDLLTKNYTVGARLVLNDIPKGISFKTGEHNTKAASASFSLSSSVKMKQRNSAKKIQYLAKRDKAREKNQSNQFIFSNAITNQNKLAWHNMPIFSIFSIWNQFIGNKKIKPFFYYSIIDPVRSINFGELTLACRYFYWMQLNIHRILQKSIENQKVNLLKLALLNRSQYFQLPFGQAKISLANKKKNIFGLGFYFFLSETQTEQKNQDISTIFFSPSNGASLQSHFSSVPYKMQNEKRLNNSEILFDSANEMTKFDTTYYTDEITEQENTEKETFQDFSIHNNSFISRINLSYINNRQGLLIPFHLTSKNCFISMKIKLWRRKILWNKITRFSHVYKKTKVSFYRKYLSTLYHQNSSPSLALDNEKSLWAFAPHQFFAFFSKKKRNRSEKNRREVERQKQRDFFPIFSTLNKSFSNYEQKRLTNTETNMSVLNYSTYGWFVKKKKLNSTEIFSVIPAVINNKKILKNFFPITSLFLNDDIVFDKKKNFKFSKLSIYNNHSNGPVTKTIEQIQTGFLINSNTFFGKYLKPIDSISCILKTSNTKWLKTETSLTKGGLVVHLFSQKYNDENKKKNFHDLRENQPLIFLSEQEKNASYSPLNLNYNFGISFDRTYSLLLLYLQEIKHSTLKPTQWFPFVHNNFFKTSYPVTLSFSDYSFLNDNINSKFSHRSPFSSLPRISFYEKTHTGVMLKKKLRSLFLGSLFSFFSQPSSMAPIRNGLEINSVVFSGTEKDYGEKRTEKKKRKKEKTTPLISNSERIGATLLAHMIKRSFSGYKKKNIITKNWTINRLGNFLKIFKSLLFIENFNSLPFSKSAIFQNEKYQSLSAIEQKFKKLNEIKFISNFSLSELSSEPIFSKTAENSWFFYFGFPSYGANHFSFFPVSRNALSVITPIFSQIKHSLNCSIVPSLLQANQELLLIKEYQQIVQCRSFWHVIPLKFDIITSKNVYCLRNAKYNDNSNSYQHLLMSKFAKPSRNYDKLLIPPLQIQSLESNEFTDGPLKQIYFSDILQDDNTTSDNKTLSSDITQGVPLLRRFFDVPTHSAIHVILQKTFKKYYNTVFSYFVKKIFSNFESKFPMQSFKLSSNKFKEEKTRKEITSLSNFYLSKRPFSINQRSIENRRDVKTRRSFSINQRSTENKRDVKTNTSLKENFYLNFTSNRKFKIQMNLQLRRLVLNSSLTKILQKIIDNVQAVYCGQGIEIYDQHIEIIVRQMGSKVRIKESPVYSKFFWNEILPSNLLNDTTVGEFEPAIFGITKISLQTDSFLSAASFQSSVKVLTEESLKKSNDFLLGLKENIIINELIPSGTGLFSNYHEIFDEYSDEPILDPNLKQNLVLFELKNEEKEKKKAKDFTSSEDYETFAGSETENKKENNITKNSDKLFEPSHGSSVPYQMENKEKLDEDSDEVLENSDQYFEFDEDQDEVL